VPISALEGDGCKELLTEILQLLPEGEAHFPDDQVTDQPERFLASEIIREKAIKLTYHEIPYALAVMVEKWEENAEAAAHRSGDVRGRDLAEKDSDRAQRRNAQEDRNAGTQRIGRNVEKKVFLATFVKVADRLAGEPAAGARTGLAFAVGGAGRDAEAHSRRERRLVWRGDA